MKYNRRLGRLLIVISLGTLWLFSTPIIAQHLIDKLQYQYPPLSPSHLPQDKQAAIVVLEASLRTITPEYGEPVVSERTLARIRYTAFLQERTKARVLVSGNDPWHNHINQADYMAKALKEYFNVPTTWKEARGYNTAQEGIYTAEILKNTDVKHIYLVTSAFHMPRSIYSFKNKGFEIIPAPTEFLSVYEGEKTIDAFLPNMESLRISTIALREFIGLVWYKIYYKI